MSRILVLSMDNQPGDALCHLPALCALAEEHETVYLAFANREILAMADLPDNVVNVLNSEPAWRLESMQVQVLGVGKSVNYFRRPDVCHPIQHLIEWCGLPIPAEVPQPRIEVPPMDTPHFDVVLGLWSPARERAMSGTQARELCSALHNSGKRIALLGGNGDTAKMADFPRSSTVDFCYLGYPYPYVVNLMRHAGVVLTVDSFPNRLAHAAGVERHLILDSQITPWAWQSHQRAIRVKGLHHGGQASWRISDIVAAVDAALVTA